MKSPRHQKSLIEIAVMAVLAGPIPPFTLDARFVASVIWWGVVLIHSLYE
jgi:hypothetical protein